MSKALIKNISSVEVMERIYLDRVHVSNAKPVRVETGFINISSLGKVDTIWQRLGNKTLPGMKNYSVNHALHVITTYMIMNDYEKIMGVYYDAKPSDFKSPMVLAKKGKNLMILDGNHRACALWKYHKEKQVEFMIPVIAFTFKKIKEKKITI